MKQLIACLIILIAESASAALTINIFETASGVEATLSGSMNLAAVTYDNRSSTGYNGFVPYGGGISFGSASLDVYALGGISWTPYGSGGYGNWDTFTGDVFHMWTDEYVGFASDYVSGNALSANVTKSGVTLADLGMTSGEYVNTITNGETTDTITIIVGEPIVHSTEPVPAMSLWGLILLSLLVLVPISYGTMRGRARK